MDDHDVSNDYSCICLRCRCRRGLTERGLSQQNIDIVLTHNPIESVAKLLDYLTTLDGSET